MKYTISTRSVVPVFPESLVKRPSDTTNSDYVFLVVTDLLEVPAEVIALIYGFRWQIELFFRWFKCILRCKHFLSLSENGLAIQI
ncbi:MAG: transposase [Deltaproteobacteria bacterium]|nr:transposase [Deltaproteobacteria bacterium]